MPLYDVSTGSNGSCSARKKGVLCNAIRGFDGPSGFGTLPLGTHDPLDAGYLVNAFAKKVVANFTVPDAGCFPHGSALPVGVTLQADGGGSAGAYVDIDCNAADNQPTFRAVASFSADTHDVPTPTFLPLTPTPGQRVTVTLNATDPQQVVATISTSSGSVSNVMGALRPDTVIVGSIDAGPHSPAFSSIAFTGAKIDGKRLGELVPTPLIRDSADGTRLVPSNLVGPKSGSFILEQQGCSSLCT